MGPELIQHSLCRMFCDGLTVTSVPAGFAVETAFLLPDGDPVSFYVTETSDGLVLEDDGDFISSAIASGIPLDAGSRSKLLDGILLEEGAYLDRSTWQIRSRAIREENMSLAALRFTSALIRVRDMYLLTQEQVASTFADDVRSAVEERLGENFSVVDDTESDNPADFLVKDRRTGLRRAVVFAANSNEKLMAAVIRHQDRHDGDAPVVAMMDDLNGSPISSRRFMMAQNRGLRMPFFRFDPKAAVEMLADIASGRAA